MSIQCINQILKYFKTKQCNLRHYSFLFFNMDSKSNKIKTVSKGSTADLDLQLQIQDVCIAWGMSRCMIEKLLCFIWAFCISIGFCWKTHCSLTGNRKGGWLQSFRLDLALVLIRRTERKDYNQTNGQFPVQFHWDLRNGKSKTTESLFCYDT